MSSTLPDKPLVLNNLLVQNVNTWGNVQYNYPLRLSESETRTGTSIGLRFIPPIPYTLDCSVDTPLPDRVVGRDMVVEKEMHKTTTGEYCVKPNPNKANERADCAINCRRCIYMTSMEKMIQKKHVVQPVKLSEMKDTYRGARKSSIAPPDPVINPPEPNMVFDVRASGRNEVPPLSETAGGFRRYLDPYYTIYRSSYKPYTTDDQYGIGAKDHITLYSESKEPKVKGFGPRQREIWQPLTARPHVSVYDRSFFGKEYKEMAAAHTPVNNIRGIFKSETKSKYQVPFAISPLASFEHDEVFDLAPFPPNPYQTNMAPFMYCSDYCHVGQGTSPAIVIDQLKHEFPAHTGCENAKIVSRDFD